MVDGCGKPNPALFISWRLVLVFVADVAVPGFRVPHLSSYVTPVDPGKGSHPFGCGLWVDGCGKPNPALFISWRLVLGFVADVSVPWFRVPHLSCYATPVDPRKGSHLYRKMVTKHRSDPIGVACFSGIALNEKCQISVVSWVLWE